MRQILLFAAICSLFTYSSYAATVQGDFGVSTTGYIQTAGVSSTNAYVTGTLGVGTTSITGKLHVSGTLTLQGTPWGGLRMYDGAPANSTYLNLIRNSPDSGDNRRFEIITFNRSTGSEVHRTIYGLDGAWIFPGNITIAGSGYKPGGGSWADSSDRRLKTDIVPISGALDKLIQLQGVTFTWREADRAKKETQPGGFIAQDLQKVFPDFVIPQKCTGNECSLVNDGKILTVNLPFKFDAYLVEALKELKADNDNLRREFEDYRRTHP